MKKILVLFTWLLMAMPFSLMALSDGDALLFTAVNGSRFEAEVSPGFFLPTSIDSEQGIIIGVEQPAANSHAGCPNGTESASIDKPWCFFYETGMFETLAGSGGITIIDDDGAGVFELDFSGFAAIWNGYEMHLGGDASLGDTGIATLTCSTSVCEVGDAYELDYSVHVPLNDSSPFAGVFIRLHLAGAVNIVPPLTSLSINVENGLVHECASIEGALVTMQAMATIIGDEIDTITWSIDGEVAGVGETISRQLAQGEHMVSIFVETVGGATQTASTKVTVLDTTGPEITAQFIEVATGNVVSEIDNHRQIAVNVGATDLCDSAPEITHSTLEKNEFVNVVEGDVFTARKRGNTNIQMFDETLLLSVSARDASNNSTSKSATLVITE